MSYRTVFQISTKIGIGSRPLSAEKVRALIELCHAVASNMGRENRTFPYAYVGWSAAGDKLRRAR